MGEKLPAERELCRQMGVSRAVVNGGITELARQGFLEVRPRQGAYVADYRRDGSMETLMAIMDYNGGMLGKEEIEKRRLSACEKLDGVTENIRTGGKLTARHVYLFETVITVPFNPVWCKYKLQAKDFYTTDDCIGCGKCAKLCPLNNITMEHSRPVWKNDCTHCMACIANCPTNAIEYGTITKDKERYNFGKYRYVVKNKR